MNSGFSDFQDLINTTTTGQEIDDVRTDLKALEETVDGNTADIASNLVTIGQNTQRGLTNRGLIDFNLGNITNNSQTITAQAGFISANTNSISSNLGLINNNASDITQNSGLIGDNSTLISDLFTDVSDNETKISQNEQKIVSNDGDILQLQTDRLKSDGSIQLDFGYTPSNNQDIATKDYVDNSTVSDPTKLNKSNGVVDNSLYINNTSNSLTVTGTNLEYTAASEHHFKVGTTDVAQFTANYIVLLKNVGILGTLNGITPSELGYLNNLTGNIQTQIDGEIARATTAEGANTATIGNNATAIGNNATAIAEKLSKSGDTMTGDLQLDGGSLLLENYTDTLRFRNAGFDVGIIGVRAVQPSQALDIIGAPILGINTVKIWNNLLVESDIEFGGSINGITSTEISYLSGATSNIQGQIAGNANAINANDNAVTAVAGRMTTAEGKIVTNIGNIGINTANISTNNILAISKLSKAGDVMGGNLQIATAAIIEMGSDATKSTSQTPGEIEYNVISNTLHRLDITGGLASYTQSTPLSQFTGDLQVTDNILAYGGLSVRGTYGNMNRGSSHGGVRQIRLYNTIDDRASWAMGNQYDGPTTGDNDFYFEVTYTDGVAHQAGYIQDSATNVRMNFTGQHRCMPMFEFKEDMVGLIVESTGKYMNLIKEGEECSQISCITINDSLPMVRLCTEEKSKKVFGIISSEEEKTRTFMAGNFVSLYDKVDGDNRLFLNGVGEGGIWVCSKNGNLENGDYICSAGINGYGMKQDDDILHNYTVAKITMDCDFDPQLEETKKWIDGSWVMTGEFKPRYQMFELDDGIRVAFVGCSYHCS